MCLELCRWLLGELCADTLAHDGAAVSMTGILWAGAEFILGHDLVTCGMVSQFW